MKSFLLFNFAITKIRVAIRLAEDGTRMGYSFSYPLVNLVEVEATQPNATDKDVLDKLNIFYIFRLAKDL